MSTLTICLCALSLVLAACGGGGSSSSQSAAPHAGGSLTVLEGAGYAGAWPAGLDPATNVNGAADQSQMNAIFGQLFELGPGGKIVYDLATGATASNGGKTWTVSIRPGLKFQDGSALNAAVVVWNINRDLASPCTCSPKTFLPGLKVTATGPYAVQFNLAIPDGAFIDQFLDSNANWIASEQSFNQIGAKAFALKPVGAGPFEVVSDTLSSELALKKYSGYWQAGHPYLNSLTFKTVGSDEAAYEAMLAGQGQVYEDMSTPSLLSLAGKHFAVVNQEGTSPYDLQLNTAIPPFNDIRAREAIYYATNFAPILSKVFGNLYPVVQGFTGPGGLCYQPTVPGYRTYNLNKARALVQQLGGHLTVDLGTLTNVVAIDTTEALQSEWKQAGIDATIHNYDLASLIQVFIGKKWQAMIQTAGSYDPAAGVGVGFRFMSASPFSGVHDPHLDALLQQAEAAQSLPARCSLYQQAQEYISQQADGPFYFAFAPANVMVHGVTGPGLSTPLPSTVVTPTILWEDVSA
jgi:peptide/nickel transport system substrate-binding protein